MTCWQLFLQMQGCEKPHLRIFVASGDLVIRLYLLVDRGGSVP
jgi:hypothetical protein